MKKISDSLEDYIEIIYYICRRKVSSRASDIALYLGVKMSSVTRALQCLSDENLINYSKYKSVLLTSKGKKYADAILHRHRLAYEFLHFVLGLDSDSADCAAQKMKKSISGEVTEKMQVFLTHHMRKVPHKHTDCKHNEMRCMLCTLTSTKKSSSSSTKQNKTNRKHKTIPVQA